MTDQPESAPPIDEDGMWPPYCNPHYVMPEEIEVKVAMNHGEYYFTVGIEKFQAKKPFLGGFRNKYTGHVYHHGSSQTPTESKFTMKNMNDLQCRETQTYEYTTLSVQPYRESGTQMERKDLKIDTKRDVILYPRRYFTADQLNEVKKEKCIIIQRVWRGYLARCLATKYRQQNEDHQLRHREKYDSEINAEKEKRKQDMLRRLHPVTKNDFEILYNELDLWRRQESQKIKANTTPGEERKKLMLNLLANETKSLQSIQQLNVAAKRHDHAEKTQKLLEVMAKPYRWQLSNGQIAFVQTQATSHAASLLDLYNALQNTELITVDARLELLHHLKQVVHEGMHALGATSTRKHKSSSHLTLIQDIMDLADREADLLSRGRPPATLYSMRARLQNLLLQYIESPVFNSRAQEFVNLPKMSGTGNTLPMPAPPSPGK